MAGIPSEGEIFTALSFLVPGFIIAKVRGQFVTGRQQRIGQELLEYATLSAFNFAFFSWLIYLLANSNWTAGVKSLGWAAVILIGPVILGTVSGIAAQKDWTFRLLRSRALGFIGARPVHLVPTAWDWKFARMERQWVLVTLKDGTRFAGFCGERSFISSDPAERDLYLEQVCDIGDDHTWTPTRKSVLITHGEIRTIEFWREEHEDGLNKEGVRAITSNNCGSQAITTGRAPTNGAGQAGATPAE